MYKCRAELTDVSLMATADEEHLNVTLDVNATLNVVLRFFHILGIQAVLDQLILAITWILWQL